VAPEILEPPFFHWYDGDVPPFTGVAVKVTMAPAQMVAAVALIETDTGLDGITTMVTVLDVAGLPDGQFTLEVSWQVIASPLEGM
jgi:hypothetical protein